MSAAVVVQLLRAPGEVAEACREGTDTKVIGATSLGAIVVGAVAFGAAIGSFRGGIQILYAATKVPLAVLLTLAVAVPAFHALAAGFGRPWPLSSVVSLSLAAAGRSALVLLAFSPALWLAYDLGLGYHAAAVAAAWAYALAGLAALGVLVRGLGAGPGRIATAVGFVAVFFAVGGQASWILRPYLLRPRTPHVPFVRGREGGFADSVVRSSRSAAGIYDREAAELPGEPRGCEDDGCEDEGRRP